MCFASRCGAAASLPCCVGLQVSKQAVESSPEGGTVQGPGVDQAAPSAAGAGHQQRRGAWALGWTRRHHQQQELPTNRVMVRRCNSCLCKSGTACVGRRLVTLHCSTRGLQLS